MSSVVTYTLSRCVKCMKCVKACPSGALTMENSRINIRHDRCLNCGRCITACHNQGLLAKGSTLDDIKCYDYTVAMIPSALIHDCSSLGEAGELFYAIKMLGFDEVVDITAIEGQLMQEAQLLAESSPESSLISSVCPVINRLIETNYPMLLNSVVPLDYPSEVAAKQIRRRTKDKGNVGIFNFCECEAKLALAKYPYGNKQYEVDHSLAIVDIFPKIKQNMHQGSIPVEFCREGLQSCNPAMMLQKPEYLTADGFDKVNNILGLAEFQLLNQFKLLTLFPCFNGCIGGHLLWGNSYLTKNNIHALTDTSRKKPAEIEFDDLYTADLSKSADDKRSFQEKMEFFSKVNEQLEKLPGYDCSACGMQTCRNMAEEIVRGNKTINDCRIHAAMKEKVKHAGK